MSHNPYTYPDQPTPQQPKDNTVKIVLIVLGVLGGFALLACGGLVAFALFAARQAEESFAEVLAEIEALDSDYIDDDVVTDALKKSPEVQDEVGEVETAYFDEEKTAAENGAEATGQWYQAEGSTGSTWVVIEISNAPGQLAESAEIVRDDGSRVPFTLPSVPYKRYDERQVFMLLKDDTRLKQAIGEITVVTYNEDLSLNAEEPEFDFQVTYYYDVSGPNGKSTVLTDEENEILIQQVRLADGTKYTP